MLQPLSAAATAAVLPAAGQQPAAMLSRGSLTRRSNHGQLLLQPGLAHGTEQPDMVSEVLQPPLQPGLARGTEQPVMASEVLQPPLQPGQRGSGRASCLGGQVRRPVQQGWVGCAAAPRSRGQPGHCQEGWGRRGRMRPGRVE